MKRGVEKRDKTVSGTSPTEWLNIPMRKGYCKLTPSVIAALSDWIISHDNLTQLSHTKDTMKINVNGKHEKRTVSNYCLKIPIHELHADMIKPLENGGLQEARDDRGTIIMSETKLRKYLTPNAKLMLYQKRIYVNVRYVHLLI